MATSLSADVTFSSNTYSTNIPKTGSGTSELQTILSIVFGIIGALAVFFIVMGGFKYITSQGSPEATTKARETIIYAIIGLVIAMAAEIIVSTVLNKLGG